MIVLDSIFKIELLWMIGCVQHVKQSIQWSMFFKESFDLSMVQNNMSKKFCNIVLRA